MRQYEKKVKEVSISHHCSTSSTVIFRQNPSGANSKNEHKNALVFSG